VQFFQIFGREKSLGHIFGHKMSIFDGFHKIQKLKCEKSDKK
jgi:hypothetical protein